MVHSDLDYKVTVPSVLCHQIGVQPIRKANMLGYLGQKPWYLRGGVRVGTHDTFMLPDLPRL